MPDPLITLRGVSKTYPVAAGDFQALSEVDLDIQRGEFVAVVGPRAVANRLCSTCWPA